MEQIYKLGKVYKITSGNSDKVYIGSTTQKLNNRLRGHVLDFEKFINGKVHNVSSFEVLKEGDVKIELIKEFEDITRKELLKHEGKYIKEMDCINERIAGRTCKEYKEDNREEILAKKKAYKEANKEKIKAKNNAYRQANKEEFARRSREHYAKKKQQEQNKK
jgi:hypothetical protein